MPRRAATSVGLKWAPDRHAHDHAARCPALVIAACASGQGKTTVTAALARPACAPGQARARVQARAGLPGPHWHQLASGAPVGQLDLWMTGVADCAARLHAAARAWPIPILSKA